MALLRTILGFLFVIAWTAFLLPFALLSIPLTWGGDFTIWMARKLWSPAMIRVAAGTRVTVTGGDKVDFNKPAVYVCNHQGIMDVPAAFVALPTNFRFVAKKSLKHLPGIGWYMQVAGYVFVDRGNRRAAVESLEVAARKIAQGVSVVVFPEGTRTRDGRILPFKKGPFVLAMKAGVPIVPVALEGSYKIYAKGSIAATFGTEIRVAIGEPIPTAGLHESEREALIKRTRDTMIDMHLAIGGAGGDREDAVAAAGLEGIGKARAVAGGRGGYA
ncbi:MAG: lysophospholipid acyltransferase family protein, partial [Myxococcales bacterium]